MGTPALIAVTNAPFLNGSIFLPLLRVPSAKNQMFVFLVVRASLVMAIASIALRGFPRSMSTLPASQYNWPNKGTHFKLFLPTLTVRSGTMLPTTNKSQLL